MTDTEQSLLTLLRRALFGCELPLPPDADWQSIFEEAVSHSVHLLVYDCLTEQERAAIPKETAALWRQEVLSAMWYNEQLLGEQQEVLKALSGLPCVILKGSSSAACYPRPELRCAGDIDLLLFPADVKKAEAILCARGYCPPEDNHPFHRSMHREQFLVELHFEPPGIPLGASGAPCGNTSGMPREKESFAAVFPSCRRSVRLFCCCSTSWSISQAADWGFGSSAIGRRLSIVI